MEQSEIDDFMGLMREAYSKQQVEARAGQPGFDTDGEPVVVEAPFDPMSLSPVLFKKYVNDLSGGVGSLIPPDGYTREGWDRLLGRAPADRSGEFDGWAR